MLRSVVALLVVLQLTVGAGGCVQKLLDRVLGDIVIDFFQLPACFQAFLIFLTLFMQCFQVKHDFFVCFGFLFLDDLVVFLLLLLVFHLVHHLHAFVNAQLLSTCHSGGIQATAIVLVIFILSLDHAAR